MSKFSNIKNKNINIRSTSITSSNQLHYGYIMETRGLRIVRFCGRYFVYYNQHNSDLRGLGNALVSDIPANLEQYKRLYSEWLALFTSEQPS